MTHPTARERADVLAFEICERARWSTSGNHYGLTLEKIASEIRAAERAAGERMRERCVAIADDQGERWGDDPVALQISINVASAIRALPLEVDDVV